MSYATQIANRYLRSTQNDGFVSFITTIAILGVALGTATLIIALSVLGGFEREITSKVVGFTSNVGVQGFHNQPLKDYVQHTKAIEDSVPLVKAVAPYVAREALIRSRDGIDGILLKGIDPLRDVSSIREYMVEGEYVLDREQGSLPKLVIGKKLAARLSLKVGDKATVFGVGQVVEQGQLRVMQFQVVGVYESGMSEYDDLYAFAALADAQTIFQLGDAVTGYDVLVTQVDSAQVVADRIQDMLGYPHYARTMFDTYRNLFSWIELQKRPIPIILGLVIIVATVNIIGTLLMLVLDKTKDIGILMSMGATRWGITKIFLRQGAIIAVIGTLLGDALGLGLCVAQLEFKFFSLPSDIYFMTSVPILLQPENFLLVSLVSVALCLVCSLLPARLASRLNPVTAIRFA
jgi:lipoprotein-releasing system permease protein